MNRARVFERFNEVFRETFGDPRLEVRDETTASDVPGWDSLAHLNLIVAVESAFDVRFKTSELRSLKNVGEMADAIERKLREKDAAISESFTALAEGRVAQTTRVITPQIYEGFLELFGDRASVHTDDAYARQRGLRGKVMHGAILNGFLSEFLGQTLPGAGFLVHSVNVEYKNPCYLGDSLTLEGEITEKSESARVVRLTVKIRNQTTGTLAAMARVQAGAL